MAKRLEGKVAIVTGGASGLGQAIAGLFAAEGASVVIGDVDTERGPQVAAELESRGAGVVFVEADVTKAAHHQRLVDTAVARFGGLHIQVNNAGIGAGAPIADLVEELWDAVVAVNLKGVFLGTKYAFPALVRSGGGVILNMASLAGLIASPGFAAYGASKAAVIHLTKITALEGAPFQIRANAICPIWVETPLVRAYLNEFPDPAAAREAMRAAIPLGRLGTPDDVAQTALFLASDAAAFLSGVAIPVDGGTLAGAAGNMQARTRTLASTFEGSGAAQ